MLTKSQLKKIEEIISKRFLRLTYDMLGERALTEEELNQLKRAGLLRESVRNFIGDAYTLGKIVSHLDKATAKGLDFEQIKRAASKFPTTEVEKRAMEYASEHAGQYIRGISDDMVKEARASASRSSMDALRAVQAEVKEAVLKRKTTSELKTSLYRIIRGKQRDWQRVASTEMNDAIQRGIYQEIHNQSEEGSEQLVYKRPSPTACKHCKKAYLLSDGVTPRVFKLSDLEESNIGRTSSDWGPTVGSVHPWCQCQLSPVPEGFNFVKRRVASDNFGRYKKGQIIENFGELSEEDKKKTRMEAILEFTGETASLTTEKSLYHDSDIEDACTCEY
jgi:hypothetical protein